MRTIESLLSAVNLIAFLSLVIPLPATLRWIQYAAVVAFLVGIAQIVVEGQRWQMIPAYAVTVILFLIWLLSARGIQMNPSRLVQGIGITIGGLGLVFSIALPTVLPIFHFPKPSGPYAIGTTTYHWIDTNRTELFSANSHDHRELMVQIWYPAKDVPSLPRTPYIQDADSLSPVLARLYHLPSFFFSHFKYVTTNAADSAPIADDHLTNDKASYPVLIYLSGQYGFRQASTFQIEALVSQGYIVVGLDQPGASALVRYPDGRQIASLPRDVMYPLSQQSVEPLPITPTLLGKPMPDGIIPYFAGDVSFALDQLALINRADPNGILTGHLDLESVGIFGVSLGGITAGEACLKDARLKACLIMDVFMSADVVKVGLQQPTLWITRDADTMRLEHERAGGWTEQDIEQHQRTMRTAYQNLRTDGYYLQIPKLFHLNLIDAPYWSPLLPQLGMIGPIDSQRVFDIVNAYSVAFFDQYLKRPLKEQPSPLLTGPSSAFPEVQFEMHSKS